MNIWNWNNSNWNRFEVKEFEIDISNIKSELHKQFKIVGEENKSIKQCYQHITFHNKAFINKVKEKILALLIISQIIQSHYKWITVIECP